MAKMQLSMDIMMTNSLGSSSVEHGITVKSLGRVELRRHSRQIHKHVEVQTRDKGGKTWRCMLTNGGSRGAVTGVLG